MDRQHGDSALGGSERRLRLASKIGDDIEGQHRRTIVALRPAEPTRGPLSGVARVSQAMPCCSVATTILPLIREQGLPRGDPAP